MTNEHVVKGASVLDVIHPKAKSRVSTSGAIVDAGRDLALLPVPTEFQEFPGLQIAETPPEEGDDVFVLSAPKGLTFSLTKGIVSAFRNHGGQRLIQTNTDVTHGSSGGPLLNGNGKLIGIVVSGFPDAPGINFAVMAPDLVAVLQGRPLPKPIAGGDTTPPPQPPREQAAGRLYQPSPGSQYVVGEAGILFWNGGPLPASFFEDKPTGTVTVRGSARYMGVGLTHTDLGHGITRVESYRRSKPTKSTAPTPCAPLPSSNR